MEDSQEPLESGQAPTTATSATSAAQVPGPQSRRQGVLPVPAEFEILEEMKSAVLTVAKETSDTRGEEIRPLIPRHSGAFRRIATRIRLLRVVRHEVLDPALRARARREDPARVKSDGQAPAWQELAARRPNLWRRPFGPFLRSQAVPWQGETRAGAGLPWRVCAAHTQCSTLQGKSYASY